MSSEKRQVPAPKTPVIKKGKIMINNPRHNRPLTNTLWILGILGLAAFFFLGLDFQTILSRFQNIPRALHQLMQINFSELDVTLQALVESFDVAILATVYSILFGLIFGALMAKNINPITWIRAVLSAIFTFIRGIPSIIWVLLFIGSLGMGMTSGIIGVIVGSTAYFARVFYQVFEEVDDDTIEALQATGASRFKIFFTAIIPASVTAIVAWVALNLENNFGASSILGTVGAGGIGYIISANFGRYQYGKAILGIAFMVSVAFLLELFATQTKEKLRV